MLYVMENIAPAVMNGGFSTILALSLLGKYDVLNSNSY